MNPTLVKTLITVLKPYLLKLSGVIEELRSEHKVDKFRMVIENGTDSKTGEIVPQLKYRGIVNGAEVIIRDSSGQPIVYSIDKIIDLVSGIGSEEGSEDEDDE